MCGKYWSQRTFSFTDVSLLLLDRYWFTVSRTSKVANTHTAVGSRFINISQDRAEKWEKNIQLLTWLQYIPLGQAEEWRKGRFQWWDHIRGSHFSKYGSLATLGRPEGEANDGGIIQVGVGLHMSISRWTHFYGFECWPNP